MLILASGSPRRRELLAHFGVPFEVRASNVDESLRAGESPPHYVERLATEKALVAARAVADAVCLAADTSVVIDGRILGKPADDAEGRQMLELLSGRPHFVLTGVAVASAGRTHAAVVTSEVRFRPLSAADIRWYLSTGEGRDKAGGYALQGKGGVFIEAVNGSTSNVIGLPLVETAALLERAGLRLPWSSP